MRIGKYDVMPGASGIRGSDSYQGRAHLTWDEGSATMERTLYFDKPFATMDEAISHALQQVALRVQNGDL